MGRRIESGAATKSRTRDLLITNQLLYQLSYTGKKKHYIQINRLGKNNLSHQDHNSHLDFLQDTVDGIPQQENTLDLKLFQLSEQMESIQQSKQCLLF